MFVTRETIGIIWAVCLRLCVRLNQDGWIGQFVWELPPTPTPSQTPQLLTCLLNEKSWTSFPFQPHTGSTIFCNFFTFSLQLHIHPAREHSSGVAWVTKTRPHQEAFCTIWPEISRRLASQNSRQPTNIWQMRPLCCLPALRCFLSSPSCFKYQITNIKQNQQQITNKQMRSSFRLPALEYLTYLFYLPALCYFLFSASCFKYQITNKTITHGRQTESCLSICSQIFHLSFLFSCSPFFSRLYHCGYHR